MRRRKPARAWAGVGRRFLQETKPEVAAITGGRGGKGIGAKEDWVGMGPGPDRFGTFSRLLFCGVVIAISHS